MAIFASTTIPYSAPNQAQALTTKALEQRLRDLQTQSAASSAITPENTQTPIQGFGHIANQLGDMMQQRRVEAQAAAQKQQLAQLMAGYDPNAPDAMAKAGQIMGLNPELGTKIMEQFHERGLKREEFGQQSKLAAEKAALDEKAATALEERIGKRPQSDAAKIAQDVASGRITKEQGDALIDKLSAPSASEMKAGNELQNQHLGVQGALSDLKEARDLLGPDGSGIRAGAGGGAAQIGAKWGGDALGLSDPKLTQRTERFNQIMSAEAITTMAEKLKGASTDFEMRQFISLMNDPNAEPATKVAALNKMIAKAEAHAALQQEQMKRAKVSAPAGPVAPAATTPAATATTTATAPDANADAKAWLAANPNDPRAEAVRKKLEGK